MVEFTNIPMGYEKIVRVKKRFDEIYLQIHSLKGLERGFNLKEDNYGI